VPYNKKSSDDSAALLKKYFGIVEKHLLHNTFLVNERITLPDLYLTSIVQRGNHLVFDKEFRASFPNIYRHFNTVARTPSYKSAALEGQEPTFIDSAVTYTPPAKAEKAPKAEKTPAAAKEPKAEKPKKKDDDEEEADDTPAEPKAKHPIESLGQAKCFPRLSISRDYKRSLSLTNLH